MRNRFAFALAWVAAVPLAPSAHAQSRVRARDLGVAPGIFTPGVHNAITDVAGVKVGHATIVRGDSIHTGVTAILPHGGNLFLDRVPAAVHVGNAFGKLVGSTQVKELGELETPILLTCTLCVWRAADALVAELLAQPGMERVASINPVVGETNDASLNAMSDRNLERLAARAIMGLARTGSSASNGSGDFVIAFSTAAGVRRVAADPTRPDSTRRLRTTSELANDDMSALFQGVVEATEEAIYNSVFMATSVTQRGRTVEAIPLDRVREILARYNAGRR